MLCLRHGRHSVVVAPESGAAIVGWSHGPHPILRPVRPEAVVSDAPQAMGCFPLVPYCNRIARGRFIWAGQEHQLDLNFGDHPHSIHGIGWQRPWTVEQVDAAGTTLSLRHSAAGEAVRAWPFSFDALLRYRLTAGGLTVTLSATNRHEVPAPLGLGLHPYLNATRCYGDGPPRLGFDAAKVWLNRDSLPSREVAVPDEWSFAGSRDIASVSLDHCFTGWTHSVRISSGSASLAIHADGLFGNLQVFTPSRANFFCAEPVSHLPDSINRANLPIDQQMAVVEPGDTIRGEIALSLLA
jgi:aldose 1-epimerase